MVQIATNSCVCNFSVLQQKSCALGEMLVMVKELSRCIGIQMNRLCMLDLSSRVVIATVCCHRRQVVLPIRTCWITPESALGDEGHLWFIAVCFSNC